MESKPKFKPNPDYRLMDQVREVLRYYQIYTHVMKKDIDSVKSPLDLLY